MKKLNRKGFSLVELIIVMAIMVALIAVLAPQFVQYIQRARNTAVLDAANQALSMVKSEYAMQDLVFATNETNEASILIRGDEGHVKMKLTGLKYLGKTGEAADVAFEEVCGVDRNAPTKASVAYMINIKKVADGDEFSYVTETAIDVAMSKISE